MNAATETPLRRWSVGEAIAWLTTGWLVVAFFLEWGYWRAFGISFEEIPMSVQYLLEVVLVWLPGLLLFSSAVAIYEFFVFHELGNAYGASDDMPPFRKRRGVQVLRPTVWGPWLVVLGTPLIIWQSGEIFFPLIIPFVILGWGIVMRILLNYTRLNAIKGMPFTNLIIAAPGIAALLFCVGYLGALHDSENVAKKSVVYFADKSPEKEFLILRNTGDSVIAFNLHARKISVIPHSAIRELSFHSDPNWVVKFRKPNQE